MLNAARPDADLAALLVVDVQRSLLPLIRRHESVSRSCQLLIEGATLFNVPLIATEQYPKGIGPTIEPLRAAIGAAGGRIIEKQSFSCCGQPEVRDALNALDRDQIILCGIEAHVCIQQTALDLAAMGYSVFVCADAIGSRHAQDYDVALDRMRSCGVAVTTVESVLFDLCARCDAPRFKAMIELIKQPRPEQSRT